MHDIRGRKWAPHDPSSAAVAGALHRPLHVVTMNTAFDRESIRAQLRMWRDVDRRLALERAVEHLSDDALAILFDGMLRLDEHRSSAQRPSLFERVREHDAATRRGEYVGRFQYNNAHGQREPWQTTAWVAATSHLFELALAAAAGHPSSTATASLHLLVDLVAAVDDDPERFVVFEDEYAGFHFSSDVERARGVLNQATPDRSSP